MHTGLLTNSDAKIYWFNVQATLPRCSICTKKQNKHFVVPEKNFKLLKGEESLTTYTFGSGKAQHTFCKTCGVQSFYTPRSNPDGKGIAVHCIDSGTIKEIKVHTFDGQNWEEAMKKDDISYMSKAWNQYTEIAKSLPLEGVWWSYCNVSCDPTSRVSVWSVKSWQNTGPMTEIMLSYSIADLQILSLLREGSTNSNSVRHCRCKEIFFCINCMSVMRTIMRILKLSTSYICIIFILIWSFWYFCTNLSEIM